MALGLAYFTTFHHTQPSSHLIKIFDTRKASFSLSEYYFPPTFFPAQKFSLFSEPKSDFRLVPISSLPALSPTAKLSYPPNFLYDRYDRHDKVTSTSAPLRQQNSPPRTHIEAISAGISLRSYCKSSTRHRREPAYDYSKSSGLRDQFQHPPRAERQIRPRRSSDSFRETSAAILYTVESLRTPNPFTPDFLEENASMSDLISGRPTAPIDEEIKKEYTAHRSQESSGSIPNVKGPREVMRERNEREARRRAQLEQLEVLERERAIEEMQLLEGRRKSADRRAAATAGAATQHKTENSERQDRNLVSTTSQKKGDNNPPPGYDRTQGDHSSINGKARSASVGDYSAADRSRPNPTPDLSRPNRSDAATPHTATRSSFPHAFERWETLSAHWEGLTSFWIRRLEENSNDINRDPLSQQLSRQVTDLSAAGANLFHAVVELQRLRASSERKFQRWFFETRSEQERNQEIQAAIERKLQAESSARAAAVANAAAYEREKVSSEKRLAEMKRELQISKEEARRAWEELGRREQEERARTVSLREGLPTMMGGVQVVPMMAGAMSRPGTTHEARHAESPGPVYRTQTSNDDLTYQTYSRSPPNSNDPYPETSAPRRTPTSKATGENNPNTSQILTPTNILPHAQTQTTYSASKAFYQQGEGTSLGPSETKMYGTSPASEASFSDENEEVYHRDGQGHYSGDQQGPNSGFQAVEDCLSEMDVALKSKDNDTSYSSYVPMSGVEYGTGSTATAGYLHIPGSQSAPNSEPGEGDNLSSFSGYNLGTEWAGVPRHRHPTRLSDVMEEDERSRTSASQVSRN